MLLHLGKITQIPSIAAALAVAAWAPAQAEEIWVTNEKDDTISVMAGATPVTVPLSPILTIAVEVSDYSLARPGDSIEVAGKYQIKGQGIADRVEIKGGAVFTAPKKEKR